jgi:hypothetical protein
MPVSLHDGFTRVAQCFAAARPDQSNQPTYLGLGLLAVLAVVLLVKAYRVWSEIHDVEEPDSPEDLLASFERAHAVGALDDDELQRVREKLKRAPPIGLPTAAGNALRAASSPQEIGPPLEKLDGTTAWGSDPPTSGQP